MFENSFLFQGLRVTALCGAIGTAVGAWIKVFSVDPNLFYVTFIGQSLVAASQVCKYFRKSKCTLLRSVTFEIIFFIVIVILLNAIKTLIVCFKTLRKYRFVMKENNSYT